MNSDLMRTLKTLKNKLDADIITPEALHKAYSLSVRLRSQLLSVIYEQEQYGNSDSKLADKLSEGVVADGIVILTIREPLPSMKELTSAVQEHWSELIQKAIGKTAENNALPYFEKAFVHIEVITPGGTNNTQLWDTSNRAINLIINNLKGIFFEDDNLEHMAFSVVGRWGEDGETVIRIRPFTGCEQLF